MSVSVGLNTYTVVTRQSVSILEWKAVIESISEMSVFSLLLQKDDVVSDF